MDSRFIVHKALAENRTKLLEHEAYELLRTYDIPVPDAHLAHDPSEAMDIAEKIGYPIVLKIVSPDIIHKSDVGGVLVGLKDKGSVGEGVEKILKSVKSRAPNARIAGVLVQRMVPQGLEVIVGGLRDSVFGPVVMFGLGGLFVEVLKDVSFRITPVDQRLALEMINEIKSKVLLEGYRNIPPVDKASIADIIVKVARILDDIREIESIDLNPIMAFSDRAIVADARVMLRKAD